MRCAGSACCWWAQAKTGRGGAQLRDVTPVSPLSVLLFGGPLAVRHAEAAVVVDGWIR